MMLCIPALKSYAQFGNSQLQTSVLYDTLVAGNNREILFNSITLTNVSSQKINTLVIITPPKGWGSVTAKESTIELEPSQSTILPLRLSPSTSKTAEWKTVKIEYRIDNSLTGTIDTFRVRVREFAKFKANLLNTNTILAAYQKNLSFPLYIKNSGNTIDNYTVRFSNDMLGLNEKIIFPIKPGADTVYNLNIKLTEGQWDLLRKEDIKVLVSASNEETINLSQGISKIGSVLKENATAYLDLPLQIEGGTMYQGASGLQYYGGLRGSLYLSNDDKLSIDYRSNTYSANNVINNNIIRADYTGKHWMGSVGNMMELSDFFMDGYGAKLGYKWSKQTFVKGYAMLQSRIGDTKTAGLNVGYRLGEGVAGGNQFSANLDNVKQLDAYTARQTVNVALGDKGQIDFVAGLGMEQTTVPLAGNADPAQIGTTLGYNMQYNTEEWAILSTVGLNSNAFPGIYKGQRQHVHEVRHLFGTAFVGAYYENQFRKQNIYIDTNFFADVFSIRTNNYGLRYGKSFKTTNMTWSVGQQIQEQPTDLVGSRQYFFTYVNLNMSATIRKKLIFMTNSFLGYGALDKPFTSPLLVNSNQSSLQYGNYGVSLRYDIGPYYYHEFVLYNTTKAKYNRLIVSPYVDFSFASKAFHIRTQLNYSNSKPAGTEILNLMGNVGYMNIMKGYDFNISGILPIKQVNANPYFNASFRMRIHVPFVIAREYYNLKLILFKDKNGDGRMDAGEEPIHDQTLAINNTLFVTNESGQALFKNVSKGLYKADFGYSSKLKGWIPVGGTMQTFEISGNRTYYVPYKKSKVIQGKITVTLDENSNLSFKPGNIKITATSGVDSLISYSTLSDENGEFYFNVPDGNYLVTLSPLAFDENFQPVQFSQTADMIHNDEKTLYFEIRQKKRGINIRKK